jgi:hypothetical protein
MLTRKTLQHCNDRELANVYESVDVLPVRSRNSTAIPRRFGAEFYGEILSRHLKRKVEYTFLFEEMAYVSSFLNRFGPIACLPDFEDRTDRTIFAESPNDLRGRHKFPNFIRGGAFNDKTRREFFLNKIDGGHVIFKQDSYAILDNELRFNQNSHFVPRRDMFEGRKVKKFKRCLFAGVYREASNISHFAFDILSRCLAVGNLDSFDAVVFNSPHSLGRYQTHLCEKFRVPVTLLEANENIICADELYFFGNVSAVELQHPAVYAHPELLRGLREGLPKQSQGKKIYISRFDTPRRKMLNEKQLASTLQGRGFDIIVPTELTPEQQIAVFTSADIIVGPHGAGLTGVFAAQSGAHVVEIFGPGLATSAYAAIATGCGCNYQHFLGTARGSKEGSTRFDFELDIKEFVKLL